LLFRLVDIDLIIHDIIRVSTSVMVEIENWIQHPTYTEFSIFFYPVLVFKVLRLSLKPGLAMPLKTCHNIEAGFLTGWLLCLSPNSEVTASETLPFPHLGCVPAVVPAKGGSSA